MSEFQIRKDNYLTNRIVDTDLSESDIGEGEVLVKIDRFAFTANNIMFVMPFLSIDNEIFHLLVPFIIIHQKYSSTLLAFQYVDGSTYQLY